MCHFARSKRQRSKRRLLNSIKKEKNKVINSLTDLPFQNLKLPTPLSKNLLETDFILYIDYTLTRS